MSKRGLSGVRGHVLILSVLLVLVVPLLTTACGGEEQVAEQVAKEWTSQTIGTIADAIAKLAVGETPGLEQLASSAIRAQIAERVTWSYSRPSKLEEHRYAVVATAMAPP